MELADINRLVKQKAGRGNRLLESFRGTAPFCQDAISPIGVEILKELIAQMEAIVFKLATEELETGERSKFEAELRVYDRLLDTWSKKINTYIESNKELRK